MAEEMELPECPDMTRTTKGVDYLATELTTNDRLINTILWENWRMEASDSGKQKPFSMPVFARSQPEKLRFIVDKLRQMQAERIPTQAEVRAATQASCTHQGRLQRLEKYNAIVCIQCGLALTDHEREAGTNRWAKLKPNDQPTTLSTPDPR